MATHNLNMAESKKLYEACKGALRPKNCYINVFHCMVANIPKFNTGEWKIAYGFVPIADTPACVRHCFIVDGFGEAIDPTIFFWSKLPDSQYMSFEILKVEEYTQMLADNDLRPDLELPLRAKENNFRVQHPDFICFG